MPWFPVGRYVPPWQVVETNVPTPYDPGDVQQGSFLTLADTDTSSPAVSAISFGKLVRVPAHVVSLWLVARFTGGPGLYSSTMAEAAGGFAEATAEISMGVGFSPPAPAPEGPPHVLCHSLVTLFGDEPRTSEIPGPVTAKVPRPGDSDTPENFTAWVTLTAIATKMDRAGAHATMQGQLYELDLFGLVSLGTWVPPRLSSLFRPPPH